jgi:hypothetical protein
VWCAVAFVRYQNGPAVYREKARPVKWTREQARDRRNALWLRAVEVGLYDPTCDCVRPHSPGELARIWGLTPHMIRYGIDDAYRRRAALPRRPRHREARDAR